MSSSLLFGVEPMIGKLLLPRCGSTPAVWTTCLLFFQVALLAGYLYAHWVPTWLGVKRHAILHVILIAAATALLPLRVSTGGFGAAPAAGANPVPWLLGVLARSAGVPFVLLASSTPLLSRWLVVVRGARPARTASRGPWFLYAASNFGSLAALLAYPILVEPRWGLAAQGRLFAWAWGGFALIVAACAAAVWRASPSRAGAESPGAPPPRVGAIRWRWIALAFVPASLMLGATTTIATDVATLPLFWVVPLGLYLATFVIVFARPASAAPSRLALAAFAAACLPVALFAIVPPAPGPGMLFLHLAFLTAGGLIFHGELYRRRPVEGELTGFYLAAAIGGALAGVLHAIVAPIAFTLLTEVPLTLVAALLLLPRPERMDGLSAREREFALTSGIDPAKLEPTDMPPARTRVRPAAVLAALVLALAVFGGPLSASGRVRARARSFFGMLRVADEHGLRTLLHGTTVHGQQWLDPARRREPTIYFARGAPIGQVFAALGARPAGPPAHTAIVGLGVGTLAAYGAPGQRITFYEIDPAVVRLARDPSLFTFLADGAAITEIVVGDARLELAGAPDGAYGLIVLDAFNSDSIPVHLLTREAMQLYLAKLAPGGAIALQITNRWVRLDGAIAALAADAGLIAAAQHDPGDAERPPSSWVVMARSSDDLGAVAHDPRWRTLAARAGDRPWTDDFSDLYDTLHW